MNDATAPTLRIGRGRARLNPTVAALMQRGLDSEKARQLQAAGFTLNKLKSCDTQTLYDLGLTDIQAAALLAGRRATLPFDNLAQILWSNRFTCCVCRDPSLAIIVHHIEPWATSRDHSVANLAVLCLEHHARAHRRGELEQNLTARCLREFKASWERDVSHLDPKAILDASRIEGHHWWWFNHVRLFELAHGLGLNLAKMPYFPIVRALRLVETSGEPIPRNPSTSFMYQGEDGIRLYGYVRDVIENLLPRTAVFNISDDLDPGFLGRVVSAGDIVLVEGKHYFRSLTKRIEGPGQASEVRREANNVRVSFTIDRWEAVATSTWAVWLAGVQSASSLVRVQHVERDGSKLHLRCTGLAMGSTLRGLSTRSYVSPTWKKPDVDEVDWQDDWLDGFGEEPSVPTD